MANASAKSKTSRLFEVIVILFVIVGMLLAMGEIAMNVGNEWTRRQEVRRALDPSNLDTAPAPTLSEGQLQQLILTPRPGW